MYALDAETFLLGIWIYTIGLPIFLFVTHIVRAFFSHSSTSMHILATLLAIPASIGVYYVTFKSGSTEVVIFVAFATFTTFGSLGLYVASISKRFLNNLTPEVLGFVAASVFMYLNPVF